MSTAARLFSRAGASVISIPGRYSNSYVIVGPRACAVADTGSAEDIAAIRQILSANGSHMAACVIVTHLHFDHILGVDRLSKELGVPVALGQVGYDLVSGNHRTSWPGITAPVRAIPGWVMQGMPLIASTDLRAATRFGSPWGRNQFSSPVICLDDDVLADLGLAGWTVVSSPGHSRDSICLYSPAGGMLIAGDTIRGLRGGEWNPLVQSGADYKRTQQHLGSLAVRTVFPGHGPVLDPVANLTGLRHVIW